MGLFDIFGKKEKDVEEKLPFSVKTSLSPVRMNSYKINSVDLRVRIKNLSKEPVLTSIMVQVPKELGLDQTGVAKAKEIRLGYLNKGEEKMISIPIWGNVTTAPGDYKICLEIFSHYRMYTYIQNSVRVIVGLRVV